MDNTTNVKVIRRNQTAEEVQAELSATIEAREAVTELLKTIDEYDRWLDSLSEKIRKGFERLDRLGARHES